MTLDEFLAEWNGPSDTMIVHTSGSTGKPKPIPVLKSRMRVSATMTCDFLNLQSGDSALLCMPLDYIAGKMMVVRSLVRGLNLISVTPSNHPLSNLSQKIDFAAMVPSQVYCSLHSPSERERLSRIRHIIIGGGAISREMEQELSSFPNNIWSSYGMTETLSHIALRRVGKEEWYTPLPGIKISTSPDGTLIIDAPSLHDGLLHTNDIAQTEGRHFIILGRKDNVICSGGIKLQIEQIEERLRPFIKGQFCISRRPDKKFGEVTVLILESAQDLTRAFESLDPYMRPKETIIAPVPMTATGKIDRASALNILSKL